MVGKIVGVIFGLFFAVGGLCIFNETGLPMLQDWLAMKNWQPVQAQLTRVEGFDTDTQATYVYEVEGQIFRNDRVYVASFKDNIGDYQARLYRELSEIQRIGGFISVWYNTANPQESVIDREMRWGLFSLVTVFCSIFVLIGGTVGYFSLFSKAEPRVAMPSLAELKREWQQNSADQNNKESYLEFVRRRRYEIKKASQVSDNDAGPGGQPWLQKKEWRSPKIRSSAKRTLILMWIMAFLFIGVSAPLGFTLNEELSKGNYAVLFVLLFPLAGIFFLVKAVAGTREWMRFGVLEVFLDPFPGAIGGNVGGYLDIKNLRATDADYKVVLECVYSYVSGSGENRSRSESIKWAESGSAAVERSGRGVRLSFRFDVEEGLPEADVKQPEDYHFWRLRFQAELPGADLSRTYNIPVFKTGERSRSIRHDISAQVQERREQNARESQAAIDRGDLHETALARAVKFTQEGHAIRFYYPMFRNKTLTLFALIFSGSFGGATYAILTEFGDGGFMRILATLFSVPFALVALVAGIGVVYLPLNNLSVTIAGGGLTAIRRLFILPISISRLLARDIKEMTIKRSGSTGQGVHRIEHFKVIAQTTANKNVTIAEDIDGEDLANQLKAFIAKRIN